MTATVPLAPCRDCGREKPVNQWCTATEECRAHTDAALEAETGPRQALLDLIERLRGEWAAGK